MRHWRNSFVTRLGVLFGLLIVLVVFASGWLRDHSSRTQFVREQRRHLENRAEIIRLHVQSTVDALCKDVLFLSHTPAVARVMAAAAGSEAEARREAGVYFRALLEVRPTYFQARLIGMADGGREMIRFDHSGGTIHEVTDLQRKGDRDYFLETAKLPAGRFHLSELNLNLEFGRTVQPAPTLRASMPVFKPDGQRYGLVIINMDATPLLANVTALAGPDLAVTLSNERGDYLVHPDPAKCFGFDLGRHFSLFEDLPQLANAATRPRLQDDEQELALLDEFPMMRDGGRSLLLRLSQPKEKVLAHLQAQRAQNFLVTVALALVAGGVVVLTTRLLARRLGQMAGAMERYKPGTALPVLPPSGPDEIGLLTQKFQDMAAKISEQVQNLQEARQCAEQATRARDEFLATMSHEIRTPMNAVLGLAHLLEEEGGNPTQIDRVRALKFAGRHLMSLLNNLLDRERIESGEVVLDRIDYDLRDLLENLRRSLAPLAERKGLQLRLQLAPELPRHVQGDPVRLYQVLNNLGHNAIKFTDQGEVTVAATALDPQTVQFSVSDTGRGLPSEVRTRLETGAAPPPGSGLGLNISRRLIELLGGKLQAPATASGTTFVFTLPVRVTAEPRHAARVTGPPDLVDCSILVVEDVASNRMVLGAMLDKTGASVDFATTAAEARAKASAQKYDFALVDMQLPDAPGVEVAAYLHEHCPGIRLSAVTAQVSAEIREAFHAAGVREFVPKPIEPTELYAKLRRQTEPRIEVVHELFDHDPKHVTAYLSQCVQETLAWEKDLRAIVEARDLAQFARLHHRLKNALVQLDLWTIDRALVALRQAMESGEKEKQQMLLAQALRRIAACRAVLQAELQAPSDRDL
jgi:signal transduction histidine kinase/ActR/RegA family two-component response regulator